MKKSKAKEKKRKKERKKNPTRPIPCKKTKNAI